MIFYIIELDELMLVECGEFHYSKSLGVRNVFDIFAPDCITNCDDLQDYTLICFGEL